MNPNVVVLLGESRMTVEVKEVQRRKRAQCCGELKLIIFIKVFN